MHVYRFGQYNHVESGAVMAYAVLLRDNSTGRLYITKSFAGRFDAQSLYWWTEGNMGCDCNRAIVCGRNVENDIPCGDGELYSFLAVVEPDMKVYEKDSLL